MNNAITREALEELINQVQMASSKHESWIATPNMWLYELKRNPQYFRRNEDGELLYCGYKVETIMTLSKSNEDFWSMADKMIKKENQHNVQT